MRSRYRVKPVGYGDGIHFQLALQELQPLRWLPSLYRWRTVRFFESTGVGLSATLARAEDIIARYELTEPRTPRVEGFPAHIIPEAP